ncbi:MAG: hypothetical protein WA865_08415 [Spirulinaceae cyanobacterium]
MKSLKIIALRLGEPPAGYSQWSLRLLANQVVQSGGKCHRLHLYHYCCYQR